MKLKKIFGILLIFALLLSSGCVKSNTADAFDTSPHIEPTVLYDEGGIKITANKLTYSAFSAELSVTMENFTDKALSFICGSSGYSVTSVNGCMIDDGYVNCFVDANQSVADVIFIAFDSLKIYGINAIADVEIGFDIIDDDYNSLSTGPLSIKTSAFGTYDYSVNRYRESIFNGAFSKAFDARVNYFSSDVLYANNNVKITSSAIVTGEKDGSALLLEVENASEAGTFIKAENIFINDRSAYASPGLCNALNAGKKSVLYIPLSNSVNATDKSIADINEISELSFTFGIGENRYDSVNAKEINILLPDIKISGDEK